MNRERIIELASFLNERAGENSFDMNTWGDEKIHQYQPTLESFISCDTSACIAGWAVRLFGNEGGWKENKCNVPDYARELLGLDQGSASDLFLPGTRIQKTATRQDAAKALFMIADGIAPMRVWEELPGETG